LLDNGADPSAVDAQRRPPLLSAATPDLVRILLDTGADIDASGFDGETLLMAAARGGMPEMVGCLIEHEADVDAASDLGTTALHFAINARVRDEVSLPCIEELIESGADVNERNRAGETPLMLAADSGSERAIDLLIRAGAEVDALDNEGNTALLRSVKAMKGAILPALLRAGADPMRSNYAGESAVTVAAGSKVIPEVRNMIETAAARGGG
jgi:ankyrin repeat protein